MNLDQIFKSPLTGTMNISLPDSDMPLNYWVALDMSKKILQKRISDTPELQGVNVDFNTLPKIQAMNPNAPMETMRAMAEDALISATVTGQLKLSINQVGYGVINAGAGSGKTYTLSRRYINAILGFYFFREKGFEKIYIKLIINS